MNPNIQGDIGSNLDSLDVEEDTEVSDLEEKSEESNNEGTVVVPKPLSEDIDLFEEGRCDMPDLQEESDDSNNEDTLILEPVAESTRNHDGDSDEYAMNLSELSVQIFL